MKGTVVEAGGPEISCAAAFCLACKPYNKTSKSEIKDNYESCTPFSFQGYKTYINFEQVSQLPRKDQSLLPELQIKVGCMHLDVSNKHTSPKSVTGISTLLNFINGTHFTLMHSLIKLVVQNFKICLQFFTMIYVFSKTTGWAECLQQISVGGFWMNACNSKVSNTDSYLFISAWILEYISNL